MAAATLAIVLAAPADASSAPRWSVAVIGTRFHVTAADGRVVPQYQLVGAVLTLGDESGQLRLRIDAIEIDPQDPDGETILYTMSAADPMTGEWRNICEADAEGRRAGFPMTGLWTPDGRHLPSEAEFSIACTGGAQAKCARLGYRPWERSSDGTSLWDHHQACTRMIRADYCGDGEPHTRNGTPIVVYDRKDIQQDETVAGMTFEAAWNADGAICVQHTRIPDLLAKEQLASRCPTVQQDLPRGACAGHPDALIFNRSAASAAMSH